MTSVADGIIGIRLCPLLKWTLRLGLTVALLALVTSLYLHNTGVSIINEFFIKPEKSTHLKYEVNLKKGEKYKFDNNSGLEIIRKHEMLGKRRRVGTKKLPHFIIIGVKKGGTHALTDMISLHPQVVHAKHYELHFFEKNKRTGNDKRYQRGLEWYQSKMPASYEDQVVSDYIHTKEFHPTWRLKSFEEEIFKPNGEVDNRHMLLKPSLYALHMKRWLRVFKRDQILVVNGDKFVSDPLNEVTRVEKFLNLPPYVTKDNLFWDSAKGFYCMRNHKTVGNYKKDWCLQPSKGRPHPQVDPKAITKLRRFFAPLNEQFYKMVGNNFSWPTS